MSAYIIFSCPILSYFLASQAPLTLPSFLLVACSLAPTYYCWRASRVHWMGYGHHVHRVVDTSFDWLCFLGERGSDLTMGQ